MKISFAWWVAVVLLGLSTVDAEAQWWHATPPAAPAKQMAQAQPSAGDAPQRTTATYGDWIVQCETTAKPSAKKICDMAQTTQVQGRNVPFSRVAVAHPVKGQPVKLVVQVPINVSFAKPVVIRTADTDPGVSAPFARCIPNGCFAEFDLKDDLLRKLRAASGTGKLSFPEASGQEVSVPLSFKGFDQAFEALARE